MEKTKLLPALLGGWTLAPVVAFAQAYLFNDIDFLITLLVVIGVDTCLGVWKHWRNHSISSYGFGRVIGKVVYYFLFLIATHALSQHRVQGVPNTLLSWLDNLAYSTILVREFLSILENSAAIGIYRAPVWLLKRLQQFDETGQMVEPNQGADKNA